MEQPRLRCSVCGKPGALRVFFPKWLEHDTLCFDHWHAGMLLEIGATQQKSFWNRWNFSLDK